MTSAAFIVKESKRHEGQSSIRIDLLLLVHHLVGWWAIHANRLNWTHFWSWGINSNHRLWLMV